MFVRTIHALSFLGILGVALTGCASSYPFACPAIGYGSTAYVTLSDPRPGLTIELCDGDGCVPGPVEMPVEIGATEEPVETGIFSLDGDSATGWTAALFGGQPVLGYRLTDSAGALVAEGHAEVDWARVDGTEQCGGNREARVELRG
ncbi:hypothetical protein DCE94_08655 [Agromyces badenianii]|nr:hypothetical protein DCE94_08655 [Agromyces badenianii]